MGSLKSGLCAIALATVVGTAAVVGCSASGTESIAGTVDPTVPPPDNTAVLPPATDSGPPPAVDASIEPQKDSGPKQEAGVDAGPPPPVAGTACPTLNAVGKKPCGACGNAETLCLADGTTGMNKWSDYGQCTGEIAGGCAPGTVTTEPCGNCGTLTKTCNQFCAIAASACAGQPANSCVAGTLEYTGAGCPIVSTYRNRTCSASCTWGGYSATCATPINEIVLNIGAAVAAVTSKTITFSTARMSTSLDSFDTCPSAASRSATSDHPYQYIELHNPTAKAAKVTVYASKAPPPAPVQVDTIMAIYASAIQPMTDAARTPCRDGVNDSSFGDEALTGNSNYSILKGVAIPAGGSVIVYLTSYYAAGAGGGGTAVGDLNINTKVESLN